MEGIRHIELTVNILWQIWKYRNRRTFNKENIDRMEVINRALFEWNEFELANREIAEVSKFKTVAEKHVKGNVAV